MTTKAIQATQLPITSDLDLDFLCHEWLKTKQQLNEVQTHLDQVSAHIVAALGVKSEGSQTHKVGPYSVVLTGRINRRIDKALWIPAVQGVDPARLPVKEALDETKWKRLAGSDPELYQLLLDAVIEQPGKPGVDIKL